MKNRAVGCIPLVMFMFLLNFSGIALCATKQQHYQQQQNNDAQMEDEEQVDDEEYEAPPGQQRNQDDQMDDEEYAPPPEEYAAPPGTLFKKIAKGMSYQHVTDLIGPPNDTKEYMTGKNFIPFYMGTDNVRLEAIYKGQGRITFTGRPLRVYRIIDNPNESGYNE
jgi:hypothetical protein